MSQQEEARWQLALQQMGRVYDGSAAEKAGKITEARDHYLSVLQNAEAHLTTRVAAGTRFFYMIADLPVPDEPSLTQDLAMVQLALEEARELQRTFAPALVEVAVKTKNADIIKQLERLVARITVKLQASRSAAEAHRQKERAEIKDENGGEPGADEKRAEVGEESAVEDADQTGSGWRFAVNMCFWWSVS